MFTQISLAQCLSKAVLLAAVATAGALTSGCATPTGAAFTKAEAAPEGQAQVYLYRKSAFQASGQNSSVQLDNQDMGELFNGSWMRLTLAPGEHVLGVKPSPISKTYETKLRLINQQTQYVEFAVPALVLGNMFMLGSDIAPRTPEQGVADMQGLKGVK
jgi:Protein of unknown function (DUF2846)